jgi:hypothetical protein
MRILVVEDEVSLSSASNVAIEQFQDDVVKGGVITLLPRI